MDSPWTIKVKFSRTGMFFLVRTNINMYIKLFGFFYDDIAIILKCGQQSIVLV